MPRLPILDQDTDQWGALLNEFLQVAHREDGTLRGPLVARADSIAALRAYTTPPNQTCILVLGYYAPGDGGEGVFVFDPTSDATDNSGTVIKPDTVASNALGRWKRLYRDYLSVRWFGARGDGSTNDADAIQGAINALTDETGAGAGTLYFPPGTYLLGARSLDISGKVRLAGAGQDAVRLVYTGNTYAIGINAVSNAGKPSHGWVITNLTIDGSGAGAYGVQGGQAGTGSRSAGGLMESVTITRFTNAGLHGVAFQLARFFDCRFEGNKGDGALFDTSAATSTTCAFYACHFRLNSRRGFSALKAVGFLFDACVFEQNADEAVYVARSTVGAYEGMQEAHFVRCVFEKNCTNTQTAAVAAVTWASLDGANARDGSTGGVVFDGCHFVNANGKRHLSLLDGDFVFRFPLLKTPDNTTGVCAPACAVLNTTTVEERAQTRIWWQDWRTLRRTWLNSNVGANVEVYGSSVAATGTVRNGLLIEDGANNQLFLGPTHIGFYSAAPVARPVLNYSRALESSAEAQLRQALTSLGLVEDQTIS